MTRGKYAKRAANRRTAEEQARTEETQQRTIQRLTQERDQAIDELSTARAAHEREVRTLRAQRDEVAAPEIAVRDRVIVDLRQQVAQAKADTDGERKMSEKFTRFFIDQHMRQGMTADEAINEVTKLMGMDWRLLPDDSNHPGKVARMNDQELEAMRAKGTRSRQHEAFAAGAR